MSAIWPNDITLWLWVQLAEVKGLFADFLLQLITDLGLYTVIYPVQKPVNYLSTIMYNKEKQEILKLKRLKSANDGNGINTNIE